MRIAVIGDLHYPELTLDNYLIADARQGFYETFMERFFSIPADLYVSVGDLTNYGTAEELEDIYSIIRRHGKRFVHVLGNHDVYGLKRKEVLEITQQQRFHLLETDSAMFAFLDTAREQDLNDCGGVLDPIQQEWLESVVEYSGETPLLVFGHHPIYATTAKSHEPMHYIHPHVQIQEILQKKQGPGLYVNGHNHYNSIALRKRWTFLQIAAVLDEQAARIIDITDSLISIDTVNLSDPLLEEQGKIIGEAIHHFRLREEPLGTDADLKHLIPLLPAARKSAAKPVKVTGV
ncbi:calcineurin-like phosphoesterase family protein [Planomicrobium soli]|uniref:Calcineurin-like phosphoesterase family protein n=1 Tax=Planomicrobium soli TaxID=1176648 RepID=A0A2P8H1X6_9BACL|nr:metallophosphoesterase [Planomicrobium soli]PSL40205.1 calcineurin-like phosphoesterase family protein [Planomicrobium soli]